MIAFLFTLVILCAVEADPSRTVLQSPRLLLAEFNEFQALQHKNYNPSELPYRFRVFKGNLEKIVECNERHGSFSCGENKFTDMTDREKEAYTGLHNVTDESADEGVRALTLGSSADALDWRDHGAVTKVKDQEQCGSCWTFSAIGAIEGAYYLATTVLKSFSEQELLDCTYETMYPGYDGCNGGWYYDAFNYVKTKGRLAREVNFPYEAKDTPCEMDNVPNDLGVAKLTSYVKVDGGDDNLADALAISPVSVAMLARGDFHSYTTGIYDGVGDCQCNWSPNHALTAVAYAPDSFVIKNSWGPGWGDKGYIRIARGLKHSVCRAADYVHYPIFTAYGDEPTLPPTESSDDEDATEDNGGCPKGTTRCSDGQCKHIHMC